MGRKSFEIFGLRAKRFKDSTIIAGRYKNQKEAEKLIIFDIIMKLEITPVDLCLDIGCGLGTILIPLSFYVKEITGIDHVNIINKLNEKISNFENVNLISGNFFDLKIENSYDKIIIYNLLHYLKDLNEVFKFINKAISILNPGGKILIGDIPNKSKKERFLATRYGKDFLKEWTKTLEPNQDAKFKDFQEDEECIEFYDDSIIEIVRKYRSKGYDTYILSQPPELPFGHTREDILIEKPKR